MAIIYWVGLLITIVVAALIVAFIFALTDIDHNKVGRTIWSIITIGIAIVVCGGIIFWGAFSASGQRALKDQQSELSNGIQRTITVYDMDGDVIETYTGKFDVQSTETDGMIYIKFDDEDGNRHLIYSASGTVIITEEE